MSKNIVDEVSGLIKLDWDAAECYDRALEKIETPDMHRTIATFADDHRRHVDRLSEYMVSIGETPPERSKDIKGHLMESYAAIRSATGEVGALKSLHTSEKMTNKEYRKALENENLAEEAHAIIMDHYEDEKRHLMYVEEVLHTKV
ncbi:MAG: ferritin-like domain-containing protein [Phycisphaerae bacterium]|nr:ferritin-like domain-containing protein [Phycisphaerae bacterium]